MNFIRSWVPTVVTSSVFALFVGGCNVDSDATPNGNAELGIARFNVEESAQRTTLVAFDENGIEVAHVDLVHGAFTPSPEFADDFTTSTVDGRSLEAAIGSQVTTWQTAGYAPVMSLPAISSKAVALGRFLEDPHVVAVLSRWNIGFEPFHESTGASLVDETAYVRTWDILRSYTGTGGTGCTGCTSLGSVNSPARTINTCGGGLAAAQAAKVNVGSQWWVLQKCAGDGGFYMFEKSCPVSGNVSSCGTSTGACKGCPTVSWAPGGFGEDDVRVQWTTTNIHGDYGTYDGGGGCQLCGSVCC